MVMDEERRQRLSDALSGLAVLRDEAHAIARSKGWHEDASVKRLPELLCLVHSEVSEVLEAYREGCDVTGATEMLAHACVPEAKPEGIASELADVIIRVLDICGLYGIDIGWAVARKMDYNRTRPQRHGGKVV